MVNCCEYISNHLYELGALYGLSLLSSLCILVDTLNYADDLSPVCVIVKDAKDTHVVQVRKWWLHQHTLLYSTVDGQVVNQAVEEGHLVGA